MQLNVFSTDQHKNGFRLQYLEIYNWGTFDDVVHSIKPMGETSLLTGANGSGKTTFVDALLTLIVPEKKFRFYNQSSGSEKKGDRTEETYVMGGYGTMNHESSGTVKTLYLRESREEAYSILLAHFANEAEQQVTLFQVRYFVNGDMKKVFGIAHKPLHIEEDFKPFDLNGQWKKALDQRFNKGVGRKQIAWFDAASKYAQQLVHVLGMQSVQALQLFNQTVGIKVLGNLDEFIRLHMLEPRNMEEEFQELKKHLATLLAAQRNIEKVEAQIKLLQPIRQHLELYDLAHQGLQGTQAVLETVALWNTFTKHALLQVGLEENQSLVKQVQQQIQDAKTQLEKLQETERLARNHIDQHQAGQRLQQLEKDIQEQEVKLADAERNVAIFLQWCQALQLEEGRPADDAAFQRILKATRRKKLELEDKQRQQEEDQYAAQNSREKAGAEKKQLEQELQNLLQSKNNIPAHLMAARQQLCDALEIDSNDLPFAGELMQVNAAEMDWQPALEKLLHSFSLRLLVADKHYKKVNKYVNNNNLRARLVYEHIVEVPLSQYPEAGTVSEKLDFHPEHKLGNWVAQQIIRQFNYVCLDSERGMERYERAITLQGLIKNGRRHEKDDRAEKSDPSRFVMGWNNEKKRDFLISRRNTLSAQLSKAEEALEKCRQRATKLQQQFVAVMRIAETPGFSSLDITGIQRGIHKLTEQAQGLRSANKELDLLKAQLQEIQAEKDQVASQQEQLIRREALEQNTAASLRQQLVLLQPLMEHVTAADKDALLSFQQQHATRLGFVTLEDIDPVYQQFKQQQENALSEQRDALHKEERLLDRCIQSIKNPSLALKEKFSPEWEGEVQHLPQDARYANEYVDWLDKLEQENLPKYKRAFEQFINDTITYKIGGLQEEMEKWERDITNSIAKLNDSLRGIHFNRLPDTFIQLGKRAVPAGTDIRAFRAKLLDALPQSSNWQQSSFEEKARHFSQHVLPLIEELDKSEVYRNRVMDVRNWFEFWADEIYTDTKELKKTYRQMGQLSGGEKAQLTYTILCSAIAYQFGITREGKNSKSLRFIAVDESFSNQDEEKATYLMELCKQLHLQLLVVTPSDKIQIVQNYIAHVHLVQRVQNRHSVLYNMTIKELQESIAASN
ncbi:Uncharacterized protein YPO0396 [Chitinophaga costaii]|uniref:Uncharacterized protein YPO0396 n=1 Tax=Chitinophaga costaii TaxID=1335309 RepID=A0A1C3YYR8_9BACT|nr:SbcC/MukB-like Walker B domain-containing protein [Chitinophaga costaii]PUZ30158.1 hypothetical protein DCM91_01405 [Chitinophaga costaii]SCB75235.1 Uncharacterized protein YPO0396 [Chitinophaga costaii]